MAMLLSDCMEYCIIYVGWHNTTTILIIGVQLHTSGREDPVYILLIMCHMSLRALILDIHYQASPPHRQLQLNKIHNCIICVHILGMRVSLCH